mmetsp:Transcript_7509/g.21244  ORF Transcript_7509/g.21244 Transcript_7509/m.21244 type:complete len:221 (-) Transcript_7509:152-814(-)
MTSAWPWCTTARGTPPTTTRARSSGTPAPCWSARARSSAPVSNTTLWEPKRCSRSSRVRASSRSLCLRRTQRGFAARSLAFGRSTVVLRTTERVLLLRMPLPIRATMSLSRSARVAATTYTARTFAKLFKRCPKRSSPRTSLCNASSRKKSMPAWCGATRWSVSRRCKSSAFLARSSAGKTARSTSMSTPGTFSGPSKPTSTRAGSRLASLALTPRISCN